MKISVGASFARQRLVGASFARQRVYYNTGLLTAAALACSSGLVACDGEKSARETENQLSQIGLAVKVDPQLSTHIMELLIKDLQALAGNQNELAHADERAEKIFDTKNGGTILSYLNARLHYFMPNSGDEDLYTRCTLPRKLRYEDFLFNSGSESLGINTFKKEEKGEMGAANMGAAVWLLAVVNDLSVSCRVGATEFPINGTRTGLMMFGPGYKEKEKLIGPLKMKLPPEYRQSILVHEARHSDCPTGLTEDDLEVARNSHNMKEFDREFKGRRCGHVHTFCPAGHALEGEAACDDVPYGAYYFGAVYSAAGSSYLKTTREGSKGIISPASIMSAVAADSFGRLMTDPETGKLDLGSTSEISPGNGSSRR
jgi:hypothetical protein